MTETLGVLIAIVSSSLGGTAAAVTRYLVSDADAVTLAILRWGIGFACLLPVALLLRVKWPQRRDWLAVAMLTLLLCTADAFLTLTLLTAGAREANPIVAFVLDEYPRLFAVTKMGLTGVGVLVLVAVARARLFNVMRVGSLLHAVLVGYTALIVYEWWLLRSVL